MSMPPAPSRAPRLHSGRGTRLVRLLAQCQACALALFFGAGPLVAQYTPADSTRWSGPASVFLSAVARGDYAGAAALASSSAPPGTFTAANLQRAWNALGAQAGALRGTRLYRIQSRDSLHSVEFEANLERANILIRVVLDDGGKVLGFGFLPVPTPVSGPPPYADTAAVAESKLSFGADGFPLGGTLTLPKNIQRPPVIVLVHGSGPNDRDETVGPNKPFRDLAFGLAAKGIAIFRYDKRTFVHSAKMRADSVTVDDEVIDDALLAIRLMRQQAAIDSTRVFVLGHSLGGMLLPEISRRDGKLAGIILAAAPARPFADVLAEQLAYLDSLGRAAGDSGNVQLRIMRAQVDSLRSNQLTDGANVMGVPVRYWKELGRFDALRVVREQPAPVLVLQGERDYQATMDDFRLWRGALESGGNAEFRSYPALNHLFLAGVRKATPAEYQTMRGHVASEVVNDIAAWVNRRR